MKKEQSYGVVLVRIENNMPLVLVVQEKHTGSKEEALTWGLPKGHVETGEKPIETARRELREETGITECAINEKNLWSITYPVTKNGEHIEKTSSYFLGFTNEKDVRIDPEEIGEARWLPFDEAIAQATFQRVKDILTEAQKKMRKG